MAEGFAMSGWYAASESRALKHRPIGVQVCGMRLVLFRSAAGLTALADRCPHRGAPLSDGQVLSYGLQCPYHGWTFDNAGECVDIPGRCAANSEDLVQLSPGADARRVTSYPITEAHGLVWVAPSGKQQANPPRAFLGADEPGYTTIRHTADVPAPLADVAENQLDVPHTRFLHRGLFRTNETRQTIDVTVTRHSDRVEAIYAGEKAPSGLAAKILRVGGGEVFHADRFFMPGQLEVEYKMPGAHFIASAALTPIDEENTRMFGVVAVKSAIPSAALRVLKPLGLKVLQQDIDIFQKIRPGRYVSTELDAVGPAIRKLIRGGAVDGSSEPQTRHFKMRT